MDQIFDIFIIGGGINGAGIARDAQGRGLNVMLVEQYDLASQTSSRSSKLIHGGLRYLEYYQFSLVRKALIEREYLLKSAPHIVWPADFVTPHAKHLRPKWLIRLGLFLYDNLYRKHSLKRASSVDLVTDPKGAELKSDYTHAFQYSDCRVHDARLVLANAQDAKKNGADIRLHTKFINAEIVGDQWHVEIENQDGSLETIKAKTLVNAAGPWVDIINNQKLNFDVKGGTRLITGSHIVVPKLYDGDHCYLFQNEDNRIVFAIPYEHNFTMIGTTDHPFEVGDDASKVEISEKEKDYLIEVTNQYFKKAIEKSDIVWSFAGVRALFDDKAKDAKSVTRDYILDVFKAEDKPGCPPLLSVYGGKVTTFRHLSEKALFLLKRYFPDMKDDWTKDAILPGGDINDDADTERFIRTLQSEFKFLDEALLRRLATHYGSRTYILLDSVDSLEDMGENFGADLYQKELDYVTECEWVQCAEDYLWRRTKMGLHIPQENIEKIDDYIKKHINQ